MDLTFIMSERSVGYWGMVSDFFVALGQRPGLRATVDNVDTMKAAVSATPGMATVPEPAVALERTRGELQTLGLLHP